MVRTCVICGEPFQLEGPEDRRLKYCGVDCRYDAELRRHREEYRRNRETYLLREKQKYQANSSEINEKRRRRLREDPEFRKATREANGRRELRRRRARVVDDPEWLEKRRLQNRQRKARIQAKAKAFDAMYEPVQTWWRLIKDALENRTELPEPPISEDIAV